MFRCYGALAGAALLAGCASRTVAPTVRELTVREYLFGAFGGAAVDIRDLCPSGGAQRLSIERHAGDYMASVLSFGLYLPHRLRVRCAPAERGQARTP